MPAKPISAQRITKPAPPKEEVPKEPAKPKPAADERRGAGASADGAGQNAAVSNEKPAGSSPPGSGAKGNAEGSGPTSGTGANTGVEGNVSRAVQDRIQGGTAAANPSSSVDTTRHDRPAERQTAADVVKGARDEVAANSGANRVGGQTAGRADLKSDAAGTENRTTGAAEQGAGAVSDGAVPPGQVAGDAFGKRLRDATDALNERAAPDKPATPARDPNEVVSSHTTPSGTEVFKFADGSTTTRAKDGTTTTRNADGSGDVRRPDGTSTTVNKDGSTTDKDASGKVTDSTPPPEQPKSAGMPDEESRFGDNPVVNAMVEDLRAASAPRGGGGDGRTDPVDTGGAPAAAGIPSGAPLTDTKGSLLGGGDARGGDVREGPATTTVGGAIGRNEGAIDPGPDSTAPAGGSGREDDPLAGMDQPGPTVDLSAPTTSSDSTDDAIDTGFVLDVSPAATAAVATQGLAAGADDNDD